MEQVVASTVKTNNYLLLRQILLNVDQIAEIDELLQSAQLQLFYSSFKMIELEQEHVLSIQGGFLYFFVTKGAFSTEKPLREPGSKMKKTRTRKKVEMRSSMNLIAENKSVHGCTLQNMENWLTENQNPIKYFIASEGSAIILKNSFFDLDKKIRTKIQNYFGEKLRIISQLNAFNTVSKNILQNYLHDFRFFKVIFNQFLYTPAKRSNNIFFLKQGQVELETNKSKVILRAPATFGNGKPDDTQYAKCLTDTCIAYLLKREIFQKIAKKNHFQNQFKFREIKNILRFDYNNHKLVFDESKKEKNGSLYSEAKRGNILEGNSDKNKLLRKYFSNFVNEKYNEFYEKKRKLVKEIELERDELMLYNIKSLTPKSPNYDQIKKQLKDLRVKKMADLREGLDKRESKTQKKPIPYSHNKYLLMKGHMRQRLKFDKISNKQ